MKLFFLMRSLSGKNLLMRVLSALELLAGLVIFFLCVSMIASVQSIEKYEKRYPLVAVAAPGSDGSGYALAAAAGHTIIPPRASLVPIICENTDKQFSALMGLSLRNVTLNLIQKKNGKVIYGELGEMLFTHFGISGPLALTASSYMDVPADYRITIDCKPGLTPEQLDARMLRDFEGSPNRAFGNALEALLPHSLIPVVVAKSGIPAERRVNQLTREERQKLGALIKAFPLTPQALRPIEEAVITAGGVSGKEIDPRTMRSKLVKGLAFAGEVMGVGAVTGGYNLPNAWATGYFARAAELS